MRMTANDGTSYRLCAAGDEASIHAAKRAFGDAPRYTDLIESLSDQLQADETDDYMEARAGKRVLIVIERSRTIGFVEVEIMGDDEPATVAAWACPGCHPDRSLDFAGDALGWLVNIGVQAAAVQAHVSDGRVASWTADPIPQNPLGLPRDLTFATA